MTSGECMAREGNFGNQQITGLVIFIREVLKPLNAAKDAQKIGLVEAGFWDQELTRELHDQIGKNQLSGIRRRSEWLFSEKRHPHG